jgi:hypothetical protein
MNNSIPELFLRVLLMLSSLLMASDAVSAAVLDVGGQRCGIQADNTLVCWGGGTPPSGTFSQISIGRGQGGCGIRTDNTLACWGSNSKESSPPSGTFFQVSVGSRRTCGVQTDNTVTCWGSNKSDEIAPPSDTFYQVCAEAKYFTCGIRTDNTLACWGTNYGSSDEPTHRFYIPMYPPPSGAFSQISAGPYHICGIRTNNIPICWGGFNINEGGGVCSNGHTGEIDDSDCLRGDGKHMPPNTSAFYQGIGTFSQVSGGSDFFSCWLRTDNAVLCSGTNEFEVSEILRPPNSTCFCRPLRAGCLCESPSGLFSHVSVGGDVCAVKMDNTVICWGKGTRGELMPPAGLIVKSSDPEACLLYGVHDDGNETQFFIINSGTSEVHVRSKLDKHYNITALDIHPQTNQVYAALRSSANSKNNGYLYEVLNGAQRIEKVGEIRFKEVEGLAFQPDGTLWGWAQDGGLFQIKNGKNNEPDPEAVEMILPYDREAEEVVEFEVNDLTWNMAGTILYGIGRVLYKNLDPDDTPSQTLGKLWTYNASEGTVSTACDNIMDSLDNVEALEMLPDDTLLLGFTKNEKLTFWTLDVQTCDIIRQEEIVTAYHDVKGLAHPDCSYPYVDDANFPNQ